MKNNLRYLLLLLLLLSTFYFLRSTPSASAITMSNQSFILQTELNTAGGTAKSSLFKADISVGQTVAGKSEKNYTARMGFQYLRFSKTFLFSVTDTLIDFGILSPTTPVTRTSTLTVYPGSTNGYQVLAATDRPLTAENNIYTIPDTTCDTGSCATDRPEKWANILTYGFGYRCDNVFGSVCNSAFSDKTFYQPFAPASKKKNPQVIMEGRVAKAKGSATITYRVNISTTQPAGRYTNAITYVANPGF